MELKFKSLSKDKPLLGSIPAINLYDIRYLYKTKRGNLKERIRQVISEDDVGAKIKLVEYINEFNKNNPHRELSNVNILDAKYVESLKIIIE